ncbi:MAG: sulfite exporter TauE/SafE family protein [Bacteroidota bacterium]
MYEIYLIILVVAFLYASVGHGGASGYLAIMSLYNFAPETLKPTALMLNLFVAGISFLHYYKKGYFKKRLFTVFAISSIPAAFLGGMISLDPDIYKKILGVLLIFAVLRILGVFGSHTDDINQPKWVPGLFIGAVIGFFSGLIGIGGGIILSPVILLLGWGNVKETAAVSALFIWVNSLAGMAGLVSSGVTFADHLYIFVAVAVVGGFLGGYVGSHKWNLKSLKLVLSIVLIMACFKLILA